MGKRFQNLYPHEKHGLAQVLKWKMAGDRKVACAEEYRPPIFAGEQREKEGDWLTWIGHSSFLLSLGGKRLLLDPVFSEYCSPIKFRRLRRKAPAGVALEEIGAIDGVLITHNHYDHLDRKTVERLAIETLFIVPAGLGKWFRSLGRTHVRELNWWESVELNNVKVSCVPAQHFSSRTLWDRDATLWCGWMVESGGKKIYAAGDTGYCPVFRQIGERFGPIDVALVPIGAYEPRWFMGPMHVNPEEAVQIHQEVKARRSVACHWGTFCLTDEPMDEPPVRLRAALQASGIAEDDFLVLRIGETLNF